MKIISRLNSADKKKDIIFILSSALAKTDKNLLDNQNYHSKPVCNSPSCSNRHLKNGTENSPKRFLKHFTFPEISDLRVKSSVSMTPLER